MEYNWNKFREGLLKLGLHSYTVDEVLDIAKEVFRENDISLLRKQYFALRDQLYLTNIGYTKLELHKLAKDHIFSKLIEDPDNFIDGGKHQNELSVTWLSEKGWRIFIEEFKQFAAENFNTYL